jgi:S1-C subfamily serine protease
MKLLKLIASSLILAVSLLVISNLSLDIHEQLLYSVKGNSVVKLTKSFAGRSGGTGSQIVAPSGKEFILTNAHVCGDRKELIAHTQLTKPKKVKVIRVYKKHDLCLVEAIKGLPALRIANSIIPREKVYVIGHPALRPLTLESGRFVSDKTISMRVPCSTKVKPTILIKFRNYRLAMCVKSFKSQLVNAIIYPGNSGSPLLDKFGNVVGVIFAGRLDQPNAAYTVPLKSVKAFLKNH